MSNSVDLKFKSYNCFLDLKKCLTSKFIIGFHVTQKFYDMNKKLLVNLNPTFYCECDTYGNHQLFFCVCTDCYKNVSKKDYNIELINKKWMKLCVLSTSLYALTFSDTMRFFSFDDIIKFVPIFWCYRKKLIKEK